MQGYIVKVVSVMDVGQGKVIPGTGLAEFHSKYQAIVLKPVCGNACRARSLTTPQFKGEVMDARITNVNKMGFFCEVGPLSVFVSSHLLPIDYKFQPDSNPPEFTSSSDVRRRACPARAYHAEHRQRTQGAHPYCRYAYRRQ